MRFPHFPRARQGRTPVVLVLAVLALPTLAAAQAVNPTDLVGSWAQDRTKQLGWAFRADSTVSLANKIPH